jgi:hypothetical protein
VVYQSSVSFTAEDYEPPETATGAAEDELTVPDEEASPLDDAVVELELVELVPVEALDVLAVALVEAETPGTVIALTAPKTPTPATAATATPAVTWLSSDRARSRALIVSCAELVFSMAVRLLSTTQPSM